MKLSKLTEDTQDVTRVGRVGLNSPANDLNQTTDLPSSELETPKTQVRKGKDDSIQQLINLQKQHKANRTVTQQLNDVSGIAKAAYQKAHNTEINLNQLTNRLNEVIKPNNPQTSNTNDPESIWS